MLFGVSNAPVLFHKVMKKIANLLSQRPSTFAAACSIAAQCSTIRHEGHREIKVGVGPRGRPVMQRACACSPQR